MQLDVHLRFCRRCFWYCKSSQRLFSTSLAYRSKPSHYKLLGVGPDATTEQIKSAFYIKSKKLHPDMDPSNVRLHNQFVELNEAYRVLSKESSRRDYDITLRSKTGPDIRSSSTSTGAYSSPSSDEAAEARRYWGQFRQPPPQKDTPEERRKKKKLNICLVCGCVLIMILSAVAHTIVYRKLEVIHNNFMDEKDRTITKLYNEAKERARINGLQKQHEIFRQRHNTLMERFKNPKDEDEKRS